MKKTTIFTFILILTLCVDSGFAAKAKKNKKNKKTPKSKQKTEVVNEAEDVLIDDYTDDLGLDFDETEIITREQIDTMFSLANQLNADIYMALQAEDEASKEELDLVIADEKKQLDKLVPSLKKSSEWTAEDEARLKEITNDYKAFSKKYKPGK